MPFKQRVRLSAELKLVGVIADREVVGTIAGFNGLAQCILDRQQARREAAVARNVKPNKQERVHAALSHAERNRDWLAREIKAVRAREAVTRALDRHAFVEFEYCIVVEQVRHAKRPEPLRSIAPQ